MGITFDVPVALLLLPPLLAVVIALHLTSRRRLGKGRRRAALAVRGLLLACLVGALAGLELVLPVDRLAVVYVVDMSDSVGQAGQSEALAYLRESLAAKKDEDVAGIVAFGSDALVERLPSDLAEIDRIASTPVRDATDIGSALRLAGALFPDDAQKRIVLLSDGNDTTGSGQSEAALAAARGIQVETVLTGLAGRDEVLVQRLTAPSTARRGESIEVSGDITSTVAQPATVRLFVNGELAGTQPVDLPAGTKRVTFTVTPKDPGFKRFRMVVEAARDTFNQNDRAEADTIIKGEPKVLVVKGDEQVAAELVTALKTEQQVVDTIIPEGVPSDLAGLADYDSIVLVDVPAPAPHRQDDARAPVVRARPRAGARDGRRAAQLRRRRLRGHAARGDAAGRHGRPRPGEAARRRAGRRHRQVGLDGRLPLQQLQRRHGRRLERDRRRAQGRHRQGGDPARGLGAQRAGRARRGRLRRVGALGHPDRAAGRPPGHPGAGSRASTPTARRTSTRASTRPCSRSRRPPRPVATSSC